MISGSAAPSGWSVHPGRLGSFSGSSIGGFVGGDGGDDGCDDGCVDGDGVIGGSVVCNGVGGGGIVVCDG